MIAFRGPHVAVQHPKEFIITKELHKLVRWNDKLLDWLAAHVLASMVMFDVALILPLMVLPMPDSVKITLALFSGSWVQWWALPALQRTANKQAAQSDAKADADHQSITYLAHLQDEQMRVLQQQTEILEKLDAVFAQQLVAS